MSASANGVFEKIVEAATESVANKGWKNATQKEITLACFGLLNQSIKNRIHSFVRPLRWAAGAIGAGVVWVIISDVLHLIQ